MRASLPVLLLVAAACSRQSLPLAPSPSATPVPSVPAIPDAAVPDVPSVPPPDPIVDLLHTVDATVAVSSKVDNPRDFPEHLVDGLVP